MILISCSIFHKEIQYIIEQEKLSDIKITGKKAHCGQNSQITAPICYKSEVQELKGEECVLLSKYCRESKCGQCNNQLLSNSNESQCYAIIAPEEFINYYIEKGYYIVSSGWLNDWKYYVTELWKFNERTAKIFFKDSAAKVLLLDTGLYDESKSQIIEFSNFIGLDYDIIPIGINYMKLKIKTILDQYNADNIESELERTKTEIRKQQSDNLFVFDFIKKLNDFHSENDITTVVLNLFTILFSPGKAAFFALRDNNSYEIIHLQAVPDSDIYISQFNFDTPFTKTKSGNGIIIKIQFQAILFGYIVLDELLFPDYIVKYIPIFELIATSMAMFLANILHINEINQAKEIAEKSEQIIKNQKDELESYNEKLEATNEEIQSLLENLEINNIALSELNTTKDKFFSIIAHDLKNPLGSFRSMLELLVDEYDTFDEPERKMFLATMQDSSVQVYDLLENLLEWSRSQRGMIKFNPDITNLNMLVQTSISVLQLQAEKKQIRLINNIPIEATIFADENLINTVIRNLISNSIKFTVEGGEITAGIMDDAQDFITCFIKDSGIGMSDKIMSKLFKIDNTITSKGTAGESGSGLGLILCKEFIEKHNCKIWVESEVGVGSTFYFTLNKNQ